MLKINISKQAEKFLRNAQPKHSKQLAKKISELRFNSKPHDVKKISNSSFLRVDSGEYRIIYTVNNTEKILDIILVGKRNDDEVYRDLEKLK